jgi:ribosomal-protein-alanine N-acetyltransferase
MESVSPDEPHDYNHPPQHEPAIITLSRGITIRPFRASDAKSLVKHGNDEAVWFGGPDLVPCPFELDEALEYVRRGTDSALWVPSGASWDGHARPTMYAIAVDDVAVGSIEFWAGDDDRERCATIGYWLGGEFWSRGIMTEVVAAFVNWLWETFPKMVRLDAEVYDYNLRGGKVLKKAGFEHLTTLECGVWKDSRLGGLGLWGW